MNLLRALGSAKAGHPVIIAMPAERGFTWCQEENRYVS
jgi:hypothetical protein